MVAKTRLLPMVVVACALVLGLKLGDLWYAAGPVLESFVVGRALAQSSLAGAEAGPTSGALDERDGGEAEGGAAGVEGETEAILRRRLRKKIEAIVEQELNKVLELRRVRRQEAESMFTPAEVEVLQSLSERREALQARAGELEMRENLLGATEKRIEEKIAELTKLEATVEAKLKRYDEQEEAKMKSLVKIYENMKPKDAARILEELDMGILLEVAERMREAKMAPILALMNSNKAKTITVELAMRRQLPAAGG